MAMEPITLFARIADPAAVVRRLRELVPTLEIDGPDDNWQHALITFGTGKQKRTLQFNDDPDYHAEPNWSTQMNGMRGYFSRFPDTDRKSKVMMLTTTFRFSLATEFKPDLDPSGDPRLEVLFAVAERLDGVLFTPSALRDAQGRILFSAAGEEDEDPDARWPLVLAEVSTRELPGTASESTDEDDQEATPPTGEQVARRALALAAVTFRALLEQDAKEPFARDSHQNLLA